MKRKSPTTTSKYVGSTKLTPEGGTLYVMAYNDRKLEVVCSVCSNDIELFPAGIFLIATGDYKGGTIPCGCNPRRKWKSDEYLVKLRRRLATLGYLLAHHPTTVKSSSRVVLHNPELGSVWNTTVNTFLNEGTGCPIEGTIKRSESRRLSVEELTNRVMKKNSNYQSKFNIRYLGDSDAEFTCEYCKVDYFSTNLNSVGVFKVSSKSLRLGTLPCRCAGTKRYTPEEYEHYLNLVKDDCFVGLKLNQPTYEKCTVTCKNGHVSEKYIYNVTSGQGCKECLGPPNAFYGFYPSRALEKDKLYLLGFFDDSGEVLNYFKIGRTFQPMSSRINQIRLTSKLTPVLLRLYRGRHDNVFGIEQELIGENGIFCHNKPSEGYGSSELIEGIFYKDVLKILDGKVELDIDKGIVGAAVTFSFD